jgi:toluene monooxygenase electron transfer component
MRVQVNARNRAFQFEAARGEKVLFAGLRARIGLPYECATGTCGTCKARLIDGRLDDGWPEAPGRKSLKQGEFLMCQCAALSDLDLEVASFVYPADPSSSPIALFSGTLGAVRPLTHDVAAFDVALESECAFEAGQFMALGAPGLRGLRGYSMVNFELPARRLGFVAKKKPGGGFSEWLFSGAAPGAKLELIGPLGKATFHPGLDKNLLCIAGGSGIAGMLSILERAAGSGHFERHQAHVYFGVRTAADAFYLEELSALRRRLPQALRVTIAFSDADVSEETKGRWPQLAFARGFVHEVARKEMAGKYQNVRAYLAGPPPAVDAAIRVLLLEAKLTTDNIRYDKFS